MMSVFNDVLDDYLWFETYMQGNVNVPGLVYDDLFQEYLDVLDEGYTVNVDLVESGIDFSEAFAPEHLVLLSEQFNLSELFGFPTRAKQVAINVMHQPVVSPVELCFMQVDIIHGIDMYWEEVADNMHFPTENDDITRVAFLHLCWCYEEWDFSFDMAPGTPGVWKSVSSTASDLVNMQHDVSPEYYFNNLSEERFFIYDLPIIAWPHFVGDGYVITDNIRTYLGIAVADYLFTQSDSETHWIGKQTVKSSVFIWDKDNIVNLFPETAFDVIDLANDFYTASIESLVESIDIADDLSNVAGISTVTVTETMTLKVIASVVMNARLLVQNTVCWTDEDTTESVARNYNEIVDDGFDAEDDIKANYALASLTTQFQVWTQLTSAGSCCCLLMNRLSPWIIKQQTQYLLLLLKTR